MENQVEIAVLHTKVDSLIEKQKELTARVRANEKVVAAVTLLGTVVLAVIGAGYFAPKAEAHTGHTFPTTPTTGEWIQKMREWEAQKNRSSVEDMLNNALGDFYLEDPYGSDETPKQEELLQLPSDGD
jgi:hypothetical protein